MYNILPLVMISPLESQLSLKCEEGKRFKVRIGATFQFVKDIQESLWLVLERLKKCIFNIRLGVLTRPSATTTKLVVILKLNKKKDKKILSETQQITIKVRETQKTMEIAFEVM